MDDLSRFCCQNSECPDYGKRGHGNLSVCDRYGPNKQRRMLRCSTCKTRLSERRGTPFFDRHCRKRRSFQSCNTSAKAAGFPKPVAWWGVRWGTVTRYSRLAGEHAKDLHAELVASSPQTREVQFDEKWSFVGKKEKHCDSDDPADAKQEDNWDHMAFDPEHRLAVSAVPGNRTSRNRERKVAA